MTLSLSFYLGLWRYATNYTALWRMYLICRTYFM